MKKLLLILALFVGVVTVAEAQRGSGERPSQSKDRPEGRGRMNPEEMVDRQVTTLTKELTLSEKQSKELRVLLTKNMEARKAEMEKRRAEMEAAREKGDVDRDKMRAAMQAERSKQDKEIKALLNDEQKAKYDQLQKEREERWKNRQGGGPRPEGGSRPGEE